MKIKNLIFIAISVLLSLPIENKLFAAATIDSVPTSITGAAIAPSTINIQGSTADCFSVSNATRPIISANCQNGRVYIATTSAESTAFGTRDNMLLIVSTATSSVPLVVRGAVGQSSNLQQWQVSNGAPSSFISSGGAYVFNGIGVIIGGSTGFGSTSLTLDSNVVGNIPLQITGRAGQTADLLRINTVGSGGQYFLHAVSAGGNVGIFDQTPDAALEVRSTPTISGTGYVFAISSANDTTGNIMAVLGNGNVGIGTDGPRTLFEVAGGSVSVPTNTSGALGPNYTFGGDRNTGMYSPLSDTLGFATNGIETMRMSSANDVMIGTNVATAAMGFANHTLAIVSPTSTEGAAILLGGTGGSSPTLIVNDYATSITTATVLIQTRNTSTTGTIFAIQRGVSSTGNGVSNMGDGDILHINRGGALVIGENASGTGDDPYFIAMKTGTANNYHLIVTTNVSTDASSGSFAFFFDCANPDTADRVCSASATKRFRFERNGNAYAQLAWLTTGLDIAEVYTNYEHGVEPGDLIALDKSGKMVKTSKPYESRMTGVYSTKPGVILGGGDENTNPVDGLKLALKGKAPVKVTNENGPVKAGDWLTSSSKPGVAMKALKPGQVIGMALEDAKNGHVMCFLNIHYLVSAE